jgi:hypothetical protein
MWELSDFLFFAKYYAPCFNQSFACCKPFQNWEPLTQVIMIDSTIAKYLLVINWFQSLQGSLKILDPFQHKGNVQEFLIEDFGLWFFRFIIWYLKELDLPSWNFIFPNSIHLSMHSLLTMHDKKPMVCIRLGYCTIYTLVLLLGRISSTRETMRS